MKKFFVTGLLITTTHFLFAQAKIDDIINAKEVERIERKLSSDDMRGRKTFTPDIDKAADFIADEFEKAGLQTLSNTRSYRQEFAMVSPKFISISAVFDDKIVDPKNIIVVTCQSELKINESSAYSFAHIKKGENLFSAASSFIGSDKNLIVLVDSSFAPNFSRFTYLKRSYFKLIKT
jgi:hypothetical protein